LNYSPEEYWEDRLKSGFNLSRTGHIAFGEYYNAFLYKAKLRALERALSDQQIDVRDRAICDIGCGTGFFTDFYARRGAKNIVGIDIADTSVEKLSSKYSMYRFIRADVSVAELVATIGETFDIVNVFDILYHIKDDVAWAQAIKNMSDLAVDKGVILISDRFGHKDIDAAAHVKFRSKISYERTLAKNGVEIVATYPMYYLLNRNISVAGFLFAKGGLDHTLAPLYHLLYWLDGYLLSGERNNMNLIVGRMNSNT
jgi:2-polyprenyl-3-methyl-5-hydroxy-6-metoxy-1,4-benzoquinol methylase